MTFPSSPRIVPELLRQLLEDQSVTLARSQMTLSFPSSFILIGASNPCPRTDINWTQVEP